MPRKYSMERRTAAVDETRQRIVDATVELHNEKGIIATSMQDIAARAGVSQGTVYRHFPSVDELIPACGGRILEINPPPTPEAFALLGGEARVHALFAALYRHYEDLRRPYEVGLAEAPHLRVLQEQMDGLRAYMRSMATEALQPLDPSEEALGLDIAMADFYTWRAFHSAGFTSEAAAELASGIVVAQLSKESRSMG